MRRPPVFLVGFVLLFPLVQALLYFVLMAGWNPAIQKTTYSLTKLVMLVLPVFYCIFVARERWQIRPFNKRGLLEGGVFGIGVLLGMCLIYFYWLKPSGMVAPGSAPANAITAKLVSFGMDSPMRFWLFGAFVSFLHSGLEEYYWRWFTFSRLRRLIPTIPATIVSGFGFMLHHVVILGVYFGVARIETWLFSLGVAVGGAYWSWLYARKDSIYAPWLSHAIIDIAIFIIGYDIAFSQ